MESSWMLAFVSNLVRCPVSNRPAHGAPSLLPSTVAWP
jgi:hypothetical protein